MANYARPETLVTTDWLADHLDDPRLRIVESDEDITLYGSGHIPGAVMVDWTTELQDRVIRDYVDRERFEKLMGAKGIARDHTVVFYGDNNNWWACYAFWAFKMYGHPELRILNGGRAKWIAEKRPVVKDVPAHPKTSYAATGPDLSIRAFAKEVHGHVQAKGPLVDVRSPGEYTGELLHMPKYPQEGALRSGHIPGAVSCPWSRAVREDGTFKSREELEAIYLGELKLKPSDDVVAYCRIGERSSHTWFVLTYLLGFPKVRNYDGSWTEWGNLVGVPIEKNV
ncbi:MAG: sulfurtransferase [Planctomycetota bacterium]